MGNNFFQLKEILKKGGVNEEEKALWRSFVLSAGEQALKPIVEALEKEPSLIKFFTENLKRKLEIMKTKDRGGWNQLMTEEEEFMTEN